MFNIFNVCQIFLLILSLTYAQEIQIDEGLEELCVGHTEPWGFVAVPSDCKAWVACRMEDFVTTGVCNETVPFNFDHNNGECNWIGCHQNQPAFECDTATFPATLHPHVSECNKYYSCEFGIVTALECPAGQTFDGTACSAGATCTSLCTGLGASGPEMIPDPTDCTKFLVCINGALGTAATCEAGQFFDNVLMECMDCYYAHCTITDPTNTNVARDQCTNGGNGGNGGNGNAPTDDPGQSTDPILS